VARASEKGGRVRDPLEREESKEREGG